MAIVIRPEAVLCDNGNVALAVDGCNHYCAEFSLDLEKRVVCEEFKCEKERKSELYFLYCTRVKERR